MARCFWHALGYFWFQGEYRKSETHLFRPTYLTSKKSLSEILRIIRRDLELAKLDHLKLQTSAENLAHVNILQKQMYSSKSMFIKLQNDIWIVWFT